MRSIRKTVVFMALSVLLFGMASVGAAAQARKSQPRQPEITGRVGASEMILRGSVISVNPTGGFILVRQGMGKAVEEIPLEVDSKTTLTRAGQKVKVDAVKPGDWVKVHYSGKPGDVAKMVEVTPGKGTRQSKPTMKKTMPATGQAIPSASPR